MQAFGIEIRKSGLVSNLYRDVDLVLSKAGIEHGGVSRELQMQTVAHALQEMLKPEKHFSICTIDNCISVTGIHIQGERYKVYSACHCISWRDMLPDFRQTLIAMILDDFRSILSGN